MPTIAPTWTFTTARLAVFLPPLIRRVNATFGTNYNPNPATTAEIETFLHDFVILYAKMEAKRQNKADQIGAIEIDLDNEIEAAFVEGS